MLPRDTSVRQLKKLRAETKGTDIGDLTSGDRLNHNVPNLQYIGNPVDTGIESWEEFSQKDSKLQTIAFKSKLVNKSIVKENKKENMKDIKKFEDFENSELDSYTQDDLENIRIGNIEDDEEHEEYERPFQRDPLEEYEEDDFIRPFNDEEIEEIDELETDDDIFDDEDSINDEEFETIDKFDNFESNESLKKMKKCSGCNKKILSTEVRCPNCHSIVFKKKKLDESVKTFEAFSVPAAKKEEKQPEYTILGKEKEPKSNPNFGIGAVKAQEIKKISDFNLIDPPTPKERTIGGNAGVFIDNGTVKGFLNRIEGKDAYIESVDEPMVIKKFNIKDVVKTKKSE